jgi:hypothetical protein
MLDLISKKEAKCHCRLVIGKIKIKIKILKIDF